MREISPAVRDWREASRPLGADARRWTAGSEAATATVSAVLRFGTQVSLQRVLHGGTHSAGDSGTAFGSSATRRMPAASVARISAPEAEVGRLRRSPSEPAVRRVFVRDLERTTAFRPLADDRWPTRAIRGQRIGLTSSSSARQGVPGRQCAADLRVGRDGNLARECSALEPNAMDKRFRMLVVAARVRASWPAVPHGAAPARPLRACGRRARTVRPGRAVAQPPVPARLALQGRPEDRPHPAQPHRQPVLERARQRRRQLPVHGAQRLVHRPRASSTGRCGRCSRPSGA